MSDDIRTGKFAQAVGAYGRLVACLIELLREIDSYKTDPLALDQELGRRIQAEVQAAWLAYGNIPPDVSRQPLDEIWHDFVANHNVNPAPRQGQGQGQGQGQHRHHRCPDCHVLWPCGDVSCDRVREERCPLCAYATREP